MEAFHKHCLCLAVAAALSHTAVAQAEDAKASVSGFVDITYTITDDVTADSNANDKSDTEGKFLANAEADLAAKLSETVAVRVDADLDLVTNGGGNVGGSDSARIEQAYFAFSGIEKVTVLGGVFNNPVGWEAEDAPQMYQTTHGQIWNIMNGQTELNGNNIAGIAAAINAGMATITAAALDDLQLSDEETSFAIALNATPMKDLDIELGYVTQAKQEDSAGTGTYGNAGVVGSAENFYDINATYKWQGLTVGAEYLAADRIVDAAYAIVGNYAFANGAGVTLRYDDVAYGGDDAFDNLDNTTTITVAGSYTVAKNLSALLEYRMQDDPNDTDDETGGGVIADGDLVQLEFVATF